MEPELRTGRDGKYTPASLRDLFRYRASHSNAASRESYAYRVLDVMASDPTAYTAAQMRAIAEGLRLGMNEGVQ